VRVFDVALSPPAIECWEILGGELLAEGEAAGLEGAFGGSVGWGEWGSGGRSAQIFGAGEEAVGAETSEGEGGADEEGETKRHRESNVLIEQD
jgi:hypothetical protein